MTKFSDMLKAEDLLTTDGVYVHLLDTAYVNCHWGTVAIEPDQNGISICVYPLWEKNEPVKEFRVCERELTQEENDG